jgi:hypothetical protein
MNPITAKLLTGVIILPVGAVLFTGFVVFAVAYRCVQRFSRRP